jgi:hypothetical protein
MYKCGWNGCEKAYGTLNHLNAHVTMQSHGTKRTPEGTSLISHSCLSRSVFELVPGLRIVFCVCPVEIGRRSRALFPCGCPVKIRSARAVAQTPPCRALTIPSCKSLDFPYFFIYFFFRPYLSSPVVGDAMLSSLASGGTSALAWRASAACPDWG